MSWQTAKPASNCSQKEMSTSNGDHLLSPTLLFGGCGSQLTTASPDTYKLSQFIGYKGSGSPWFPAGFSLISKTGATFKHITDRSTTRQVNGT
jgi:hypothetical protein